MSDRDDLLTVDPPARDGGEHPGARDASFRFRRIGERVVLTNEVGQWLVVDAGEFDAIVERRVDPDSALQARLEQAGMLLDRLDVEDAVERYRRRKSFVGAGPHLHIVVVTLRCNEVCVYCHASREPMSARGADMTVATAKQVVDRIFESPSRSLSIEFQGGEPLVAFDTVRFIVEYATERNADEGRELRFLMVTNLAAMDDDKLAFLMEHDVLLCTSLDGPRELHDRQRTLRGGSAYDVTVGWLDRINAAYRDRGLDPDLWHVDALLTVTRHSFGHAQAILDEYLSHGIKTIHVRALNPMGFADKTWDRIGYTPDEFIAFWRDCLDRIVELNLAGTEMVERGAALFLASILTDDHHGYVDLRSPCGAGVGQIAYDQDGRLFPCDEARMVARMGDDVFQLGHVGDTGFREVVAHETVRSIGVASTLEGLPGCRTCAYMPYCGVCPVVNYVAQGDLFGHRTTSDRCRLNLLAQDHLFDILATDRPGVRAILERWTIQKSRTATRDTTPEGNR